MIECSLSLKLGLKNYYGSFIMTERVVWVIIKRLVNHCLGLSSPVVSNSSCSKRKMRICNVSQGLHYDADATMTIPKPY